MDITPIQAAVITGVGFIIGYVLVRTILYFVTKGMNK